LNEVNNVVEKNKLLLKQNNIKINNNIDENIMIESDKLRLEELFDNLINNAIKYGKGTGTITIDAKEDKDFVTVFVKDTGMGMNEKQLSRIFDEFYKADDSRHDFDSSGLGLPICKRIVEKHGGKIWAESLGEGKGTTMFFTIPTSSKDDEFVISIRTD
jgi:signal transduction histidine kinase